MVRSPAHGSGARIPLRRLTAAAFLHVGLLAYLVLVPISCLLFAPAGAGAAAILSLGIRFSGMFLAGFAMIALIAIGIAGCIDARGADRRRRAAGTDAAVSEWRVSTALALATERLDGMGHAPVARLAARAWDHDDFRDQALARDLAKLVDTAVAAMASASPEQAAIIEGQTAASLEHLDRALAANIAERAAETEQVARATALYVRQRYADTDFATKPD